MDRSKIWFWILLDVLIVVVVVAVLFGVWPFLSRLGSAYQPARVISVSAQGKTTATPDMAELSFSVVTQGKDPADLSNKNNDKMAKVVDFIKSQGVASEDVKTTSYDLQPNYESTIYPNAPISMVYPLVTRTSPTIIGYTLTQTVDVKVRDLTKVATIMGGLAPLGINQIGGVSFTFTNEDKVVAAARTDALAKAKEKAKAMADAAGASLGAVININESYYFPMGKSYGMGGAYATDSSQALPPISPGTQDITDNVNITYELK